MPMSSARAREGFERAAVEFDAFASSYQEHLDQSVRLSGEAADYFAAYKASYVVRKLAPRGGKLLDYGCGIGLLAASLKKRLPQMRIDGFDISQESVDRIAAGLRRQGTFTSDVRAVERSYDVIVLSNVLHHVRPEERVKLIVETTARLAENGKLVIFEHNPMNPLTRWAVSHCEFDRNAVLLNVGEAFHTLREAKLRVLTHEFIVFFPRLLAWFRPLEPSLHWCPLGAQYAIVAKRDSSGRNSSEG
jgi:2-polyprenyl-3-methyl-5-hydroxy-6-metoxy-1,4-benzoquinol methylase